MNLQTYETIYFTTPDLPEETFEALTKRIEEGLKLFDGKVIALNDWGKRRLAYEVKKNSKGHYYQFIFQGKPGIVAEVERNLRLSPVVMKYLTVKLDEEAVKNIEELLESPVSQAIEEDSQSGSVPPLEDTTPAEGEKEGVA